MTLLACTLALTSESEAESGGPVGGATSPLGWYVEDGDEAQYQNEVIMLNGDLIIQDGGSLEFDSVTMYSNARGEEDQAIRILVEEGGSFTVRDSTITATIQVDEHKGNQPVRYKFQVYGSMNLTTSTVSFMWGEVDGFAVPSLPLPGSVSLTPQGGLEIYSDDVFISDCIITEGQASGICINDGSPTIVNTEFLDNGHHGLAIPTSTSWAVITDCYLHDNEYFGVFTKSGNITFRDNVIENNDWMGFIASYVGKIVVEDCEIIGQRKGIWVIDSEAEFWNCSIDNDENFDLRLDSVVAVVNDLCDIEGEKAVVLQNSSLLLCPMIDLTVMRDGEGVNGAVVSVTGEDGNFTWSRDFITDSNGKVLAYAAITLRFSEVWYNISMFRIVATNGSDEAEMTENISISIEVTLHLETSGSDGGLLGIGDDDDENFVGFPWLFSLIGILVALTVREKW